MTSSYFARLTPENAAAQKCLASLVDKGIQKPELYSISPTATLQVSPTLSRSNHRVAQSRYQLSFSFENQGYGYNGAWVVGKPGLKTAATIDLPICSSRSRQLKGPKVCEIFIHPQSGVLLLRNINRFHSIIYLQADGDSDIELRYGDEHVLHMTTNHLRIGPLDYNLNIAVDDENTYLTDRKDYMRRWYQDWDCSHVQVDPLPRPTHVRMGNIIIHRTVSQGAFGVVRIGVDRRSGDIVACKTIHCRRRDIETVSNEIAIASTISHHAVGLVPLFYSWCEHGLSPPCFKTALEDVHLLMPYAPFSFDTIAWHEVPLATRLELFRQVMEGLRNLHAMGIMHRDISPRNLLVFSYQPPTAAICDFGKSKQGTKGIQASLGPPAFTAPEVGEKKEHTNSVDVFSLGLSMLATFTTWRWPGPMSTPDNYANILKHLASLQGRMPDDLGVLLRSMLAWDPNDRPTAEQALAAKVWGLVAGVSSSETKIEIETQTCDDGSGPDLGSIAIRLQRSGGGPSLSSSGILNKRSRRSEGPTPSRSEMHSNKKTRISNSSSFGGGEKRPTSSGTRSLLSPPPVL